MSLLVTSSPDMHLVGFFDQPVSEIRMCNGNDLLRSFPCRQSLEADLAIFGYQIVRVGSGICNDGSRCQCRLNTGFHGAVLSGKGGRTAYDTLTAM